MAITIAAWNALKGYIVLPSLGTKLLLLELRITMNKTLTVANHVMH